MVATHNLCYYIFFIHLSIFFFLCDQVLFVHGGHGGHSLFAVYTGRTRLLFIEDKQVSVRAFVQPRVMAEFLVCLFCIYTLCLWKHWIVFVFVLEFVCVCVCVCVCVVACP